MRRSIHGTTLTLGAMIVLLANSACVPPATRPDVEFDIPDEWSGGDTAEGMVDVAWWKGFGSETLNELIEEGLARNYDLIASVARIDAAAAQAVRAGADLYPNVDAQFNGSRERQVFVGLPIPGSSDVLINRFTQYGLSLNTVWEVDLWGRVRASKAAAVAEFEAAEVEYEAARLSLAGQTARAFFAVTEADLQVRLAETTVASWRSSSEQVRDRFERGLRSSLDLRLALSNLAAAEAVLEQRKFQRDGLTRQLETLVSRYPRGTLEPAADLPALADPIPSGLPSELLRRRPDLFAAEKRVAAASARVHQAKVTLLPRISLTASGGTTSDRLEDLTSNKFSVWSIGGNVVQPIFEAGRIVAGIHEAEAFANEAIAVYADTALNAFREVETALSAETTLADRERFLRTNVEQSERAESLALDRYLRGLEDYITVLEAQRRTALARSDLISVRGQRIDNRIDLILALGGGWEVESDDEDQAQSETQTEEPAAATAPEEAPTP